MTAHLSDLVRVRSQFSLALADYYTRLVDRLDRTPWYRQGTLVRAGEVAVPIRVLKEASKAGDGRGRAAQAYIDPEIAALYEESAGGKAEVTWAREQRQVQRAVVLGPPGGGKSMLSALTAIDLAESALQSLRSGQPLDDLSLVVHLPLPALADPALPQELDGAILHLLRFPTYGALSPHLVEWVRAKLPEAQTWLILDGLDEVLEDQHETLRRRLLQLDTFAWRSRCLLTCRTANYGRSLIPWRTLVEYELAPFRLQQEVRPLVETWFAGDEGRRQGLPATLRANYTLAHAARTPLVAMLICLAHEQQPLDEQTRRSDLYAHVLHELARRAWKQNPLSPSSLRPMRLLRKLEPAAWRLFARHPEANRFSYDEVTAVIDDDLLDELLECGILVRSGREQFSLLHRSFLEYLAAAALARQVQGEGWDAVWAQVAAHLYQAPWQEMIALLAGCLDDAGPLLAALLHDPDRDPFHYRHLLAARCIGEAGAGRVDPALVTRLVDYLTLVVYSASDQDRSRAARGLAQLGRSGADHPGLDRLLRLLDDADAHVRQAAVEAMGEAGNARHVDRLLGLLFDKNPRTRWITAEALGRIGDARALDPLTKALVDPVVSTEMGRALGQIGDARVLDVLLTRLTDPDMTWVAAEALARIGGSRVLRTLLSLVSHADATIRWAVVWALGQLGDTQTATLLLALLRDPDKNVCDVAVETLGRIGDERLVESLLQMLSDSAPNVRQSAVVVLGSLGDARALRPLLEQLGSPHAEMRRSAAEALGRIGREEAVQALLGTLADPVTSVREAAAEALGRLGDTRAVSPLIKALDEWFPFGRRSAAEALGQIGDTQAVQPLLAWLSVDPVLWVDLAGGLVTNYLSSASIKSLLAFVARAIVRMPGQLSDIPAVGPLLSMLHNSHGFTRRAAAQTLGELGDARAAYNLLTLLDDPDWEARSAAHEALRKLYLPSRADQLARILLDLWQCGDQAQERHKEFNDYGEIVSHTVESDQLARALHVESYEQLRTLMAPLADDLQVWPTWQTDLSPITHFMLALGLQGRPEHRAQGRRYTQLVLDALPDFAPARDLLAELDAAEEP